MRQQLCVLFFALTSSTFAFSENIYCPPEDAVHCTHGKCTFDAPYSNDWRMNVVGEPNGHVFFADLTVQNPPHRVECFIGSGFGNFVVLHSNNPYSPDTSVPGNAWKTYPGNVYVCEAPSNPKACPLR